MKTDELTQLEHYNTAEISDALDACGVEGVLLHIKPLAPGMKLVGPAYTIKYASHEEQLTTFQNAAHYIDTVPQHSVLVIDNDGRKECTVWGDILTQVALQNNLAGTVVHGSVRDVASICRTQYPVFCAGITMRSGKNRVYKIQEQCPLFIDQVPIIPGDIIFADDNGVLVIPKQLLTEILTKAKNIRATEEYIKSAVQSGMSLEQARIDYGYDKPWLDGNNK